MAKKFLNGADLAGELGITRGRVSQLTTAGVLIKHPAGYELGESVQHYVRNKLQNIDPSEAEKLLESRLRKLSVAVDRERLMLTRINGQIVASTEAESVYTEQRERAFEGFDALLDIAPELENCREDKSRVFELIDQEVRLVLTKLASTPVMKSIK